MAEAARKLVRHLGVTDEVAQKLIDGGYLVPSVIRETTKRKLRADCGLTQAEVDTVKARWD